MSSGRHPLTAKDVFTILKNLGFTHRNTEGSHQNWVRYEPAPFRKVTVDPPKAPFSHVLIGYMARQAGVSVSEFYRALDR